MYDYFSHTHTHKCEEVRQWRLRYNNSGSWRVKGGGGQADAAGQQGNKGKDIPKKLGGSSPTHVEKTGEIFPLF